MAIKKKPVKPAKKAQPKKAAKPAAKKVVAKKVSAVKPVKKDTSKKHVTVTKKTTVSTGKPAHPGEGIDGPRAGAIRAAGTRRAHLERWHGVCVGPRGKTRAGVRA